MYSVSRCATCGYEHVGYEHVGYEPEHGRLRLMVVAIEPAGHKNTALPLAGLLATIQGGDPTLLLMYIG